MLLLQTKFKNEYFRFYTIYKNFYFLWLKIILPFLRNNQKGKFIFYFKFLRKKKKRIFYFFKKNDYKKIDANLVMKRKYGVLKYKFNERSFLLHKANSYLNLKKKKKKRIKDYLGLLKKKHMGKLFYKNVRNSVFINLKYSTNRQFKKSKILYNLYNKKNDPRVNRFDVLVYSLISLQLFVNFKDATNYIKNFGIHCNFNLVKNPYFLLNLYDIVQLKTDYVYYYYLKNFNKNFRKHFRKVKPRIFKLIRGKYDINKQSATSIPKWVLNFKTFKEYKPNNFEYDLITFTYIVLFKNNNYQSITYSNNYILSLYMYRLYNWRYIV